MSTQITKDEYKILKHFMKKPDVAITETEFNSHYPYGSEIRISALHLCDENLIDYIDSESKNTEDTFKISRQGRFAYKTYKEHLKQKRKDFMADKFIDFCAVIISLVALLKSFETEILYFITWCKQLLELQ